MFINWSDWINNKEAEVTLYTGTSYSEIVFLQWMFDNENLSVLTLSLVNVNRNQKS